jgi:5'-nucleotidase
MNVLLTNDDGIYAPGLEALYKHLAARHSVSVIAPDREQSAVGHGITLDKPLRTNRVFVNHAFQGYAVSGTPADCIKMGVLEILKSKPDIVISGINPGANVGVNINYSGTVAAAKEAALYGILAMAVSIHSREVQSYEEAAVNSTWIFFRNTLKKGPIRAREPITGRDVIHCLQENQPMLTDRPCAQTIFRLHP